HDGGLVGMYMFYPKGKAYRGTITDNYVSGKITFFEDNKNRRAYCTGFIGEIMNWDFENGRNKNDFVRDEVFQYDKNLLPHTCDNPVMREEVVTPTCEFGYTHYVCETCGYEENDHYTLKCHAYEWQTVKEPTESEEGLREGTCKDCGTIITEAIPMIIPEPTMTPEPVVESLEEVQIAPEEDVTTEATAKESAGTPTWVYMVVGAAVILVVAGVVLGLTRRKRK
ncbi:MAG: hypothetical protein J6Z22_06995, partial [Lachnospiraceae bacterium]|nr:hypothetical protein [Lachnospiraceae bacterium]